MKLNSKSSITNLLVCTYIVSVHNTNFLYIHLLYFIYIYNFVSYITNFFPSLPIKHLINKLPYIEYTLERLQYLMLIGKKQSETYS